VRGGGCRQVNALFLCPRLPQRVQQVRDRGQVADGGVRGARAARAIAWSFASASRSTRLLARRGNLNGLGARASGGDREAAGQLAGVLEEQGRHEEAQRLRRLGLDPDGSTTRA
jgi:hypothetical protein